MKKRYEYIWEAGQMRVFEYDGYSLCHEYRGFPIYDGYVIALYPCKGGFVSAEYPYYRKTIGYRDLNRIDRAPRLLQFSKSPSGDSSEKKQSFVPTAVENGKEKEWEQLKLL